MGILIIVVMGVSGSGKTTVGQKLARELGWTFADADDFHPAANIEKMRTGSPLTDADRAPWLAILREFLAHALRDRKPVVLACSALKAAYRAQLTIDRERQKFVFLTGSFELIHDRLRARQGHYMKEEMLRSQFAALEPPEDAIILDITPSPGELVAQIRAALAL